MPCYGLVPVEEILIGEAVEDQKNDPLELVFRQIYDLSQHEENKKVKMYHQTFNAGIYLSDSCQYYSPVSYANSWREKQAKRSVTATLQWIGLDQSMKSIGALAKSVEMSDSDYARLTNNLLTNFCSQNLTVISLKNVKKSLSNYFKNPQLDTLPSSRKSPFVTSYFKKATDSDSFKYKELDYAIKNFRAFCSWGGDVDDYRLLGPYLKNPFIMAHVIKQLSGQIDVYSEKNQKVSLEKSAETTQVVCEDLICRRESREQFLRRFPLSTGSSGLETDLTKLYCDHFRFQDYSGTQTIPKAKEWIKEAEGVLNARKNI
jgi:hypothetical protein